MAITAQVKFAVTQAYAPGRTTAPPLLNARAAYQFMAAAKKRSKSMTEEPADISNNVAKWIDPTFSLLEALVADSIWRTRWKNPWRILRELRPSPV